VDLRIVGQGHRADRRRGIRSGCRRFHRFPCALGGASHAQPGPDDLVYLCGGENREFEVADFPKLGKRMVRTGKQLDIYDASDAQPFGPITR
jgi:hypothetical protein